MSITKAIFCCLLLTRVSLSQSVFPVRDQGEARNRSYHVLHYKIDVALDESNKSVRGNMTAILVPFLADLRTLEFDAEEMQIQKVTLQNKTTLPFDILPKTLSIHLDKAYSSNDTLRISVEYTCTPKKGLYFVQPDSAYPEKPWQIWSQGEDMDNHFWFPCYDFPNDMSTSEMIVTVRNTQTALSNGKLLSVTEDKKKGTKTFHWFEGKPHVTYLIMIAVGQYAVLNDKAGTLPLQYYVYPRHTEDAKICFQETPAMITYFNQKIGFVYPWEKYAQVIVADFIEGGMENASATTLMDDITVFDARVRVDQSPTSLLAHELAHQWWGDVVTCKDWRHLWLNEGFASYFDPLYHEYSLGQDEFDFMMHNCQQAGIRSDKRLGRKPIVSVGSYGDNVYSRAAAVLHMLRFVLGDHLFWRSINHYITKHQFTPVETNDFKNAIEEETGQNLYWFFDEWLYKSGYPIFDVSYRWSDSAKAVLFSVKQTQTKDSLTGFFRTPVDIELNSSAGTVTHRVNILSSDTTFLLPSTEPPQLVIFDKGNWLLKELKFEKPVEEWKYQAEHATNPIDRMRALQELAERQNSEEFIPTFANRALHDSFWAVRREAINLFPGIRTGSDSVKRLIQPTLIAAAKDPRSTVRDAAFSRLANFRGDAIVATLKAGLHDSSYTVMSTALRSLAKADSDHAVETLNAYLDIPSHNSTVSNAALNTLASIDSSKAVTLALSRVRYGQPQSTRFTAANILSRYGKHRADVKDLFIGLLTDKSSWIKASALHTLGEIGDEQILPLLQPFTSDNNTWLARTAKESIEKIRKRTNPEKENG